MAQTKRKRRSKHRGTAAGSIEARGRTGRPPTAEERKKLTRVQAREKRLSTPPTWKASLMRAAFAAVIMFAFLALTTKGKIARYKVPRYIRFTSDFPTTVTGKIRKFKMRQTSITELGLQDASHVTTA